jgi:hypothetical protein
MARAPRESVPPQWTNNGNPTSQASESSASWRRLPCRIASTIRFRTLESPRGKPLIVVEEQCGGDRVTLPPCPRSSIFRARR